MIDYEKLKSIASDNGFVLEKNHTFLSLYPKGMKENRLLELEITRGGTGFIINHHRTLELTAEYKGKRVSENWMKAFISHNERIAHDFSTKVTINDDELKKLKKEVREIPCQCMGEVENCNRCFGRGTYQVKSYSQFWCLRIS